MYLFLNSPKKVMHIKVKQYNVIAINPSPLPTPINKLYFLKYGDAKHDIILIIKNIIAHHCILSGFNCLIYSSFFLIE